MGRPGEKRNYKKEDAMRFSDPNEREKHNERMRARRAYEKKHGDLPSSVHVDHKTPLKKGGSNSSSNLRAIPADRNAGWRKGQKGYKVKKV
jgi:5-methylcytosine-specific restriction endonuclease McrA